MYIHFNKLHPSRHVYTPTYTQSIVRRMHIFPRPVQRPVQRGKSWAGHRTQTQWVHRPSSVWVATIHLAETAWRLCGTSVYVCSMLHICIHTYTIDRVSVINKFNFSKQIMPAHFVNFYFYPKHNYDDMRIVQIIIYYGGHTDTVSQSH